MSRSVPEMSTKLTLKRKIGYHDTGVSVREKMNPMEVDNEEGTSRPKWLTIEASMYIVLGNNSVCD